MFTTASGNIDLAKIICRLGKESHTAVVMLMQGYEWRDIGHKIGAC
jgi:hypothetical protein